MKDRISELQNEKLSAGGGSFLQPRSPSGTSLATVPAGTLERGTGSVERGMMQCVCAWCAREYGRKEGTGVTHGICERCAASFRHELEPLGMAGERRAA